MTKVNLRRSVLEVVNERFAIQPKTYKCQIDDFLWKTQPKRVWNYFEHAWTNGVQHVTKFHDSIIQSKEINYYQNFTSQVGD